eukprot:1613922-Pleurochrysis_carterae.AAC.1
MAGAGGRGGGRGDGDDAGDTDDDSTLAWRRRRHACTPAHAREETTCQERDSALSGTRTPHDSYPFGYVQIRLSGYS